MRAPKARLAIVTCVLGVLTVRQMRAEATARIVIHVTDYAQVPSRDLSESQHVLVQLLGSVGVTIVWRESRGPIAPAPSPGEISVLILSPTMVRQKCEMERLPQTVLGMAAPFPARRVWVFYDRVHEAAFVRGRSPTWVLGYVIGHEIGHILGELGHTERGVMTRTFEENAEIMDGFSPEQGRRIRAGLLGHPDINK